MTAAGETWAIWLLEGAQYLACVAQSEAVIEALPDDAWIELRRVSALTVQVGMTQRGPAVVPVTLPLAATSDEAPRVRVRMRAVSAIWWFSLMPERTRRELEKRTADASQAATSLAASSAGIMVR